MSVDGSVVSAALNGLAFPSTVGTSEGEAPAATAAAAAAARSALHPQQATMSGWASCSSAALAASWRATLLAELEMEAMISSWKVHVATYGPPDPSSKATLQRVSWPVSGCQRIQDSVGLECPETHVTVRREQPREPASIKRREYGSRTSVDRTTSGMMSAKRRSRTYKTGSRWNFASMKMAARRASTTSLTTCQ